MKEEKIYSVPVVERGVKAEIKLPPALFSIFDNAANTLGTAVFLGLILMGIIQAAGLVLAAWILK